MRPLGPADFPISTGGRQTTPAQVKELVAGFTGGDPEIQKGLNAMYADQANWPEGPKRNWRVRPEIQDFILKAMKSAGGSCK